MFSLHNLFEGKPDHPMSDAGEAKKLLAGLPKNDPFKALDEITSWLTSVKDTPGFHPETRAEIVMLLDETGQPLHAALLHQYLGAPHLQDFQGLHQWRGLRNFVQTLAEAYALCIAEFRQAKRPPSTLQANMPTLCARLLRAITDRMKLEMIRYVEIDPSSWRQLYDCYHFAETGRIAETMVHAYPGQAFQTSPQRELLRALVLYLSSPETLTPEQVEVCYRIAGRMTGSFDFRAEPDADCTHFIDLSGPHAPADFDGKIPVTPSMRFFGAARAVPKIKGIIEQNEHNLIEREQRFGNEFTPQGKLTVLRHLALYWGKDRPHRHQERKGIHASIEVVHGFKTISRLVKNIDPGRTSSPSGKEAVAPERQPEFGLAADDAIQYTTETWAVSDVSADGIGGILPKTAGEWVKAGALCGLRPRDGQPWWVGMIRRLHTGPEGAVHVGIEILAKKPLSVWLRALGRGAEKTSNWETSSGSFEYDYLPVILLPDADQSYLNAIMLMESGSYVPDSLFEMMMGEKSRDVRLTGLLAEGEDYEQASFQWLGQTHT